MTASDRRGLGNLIAAAGSAALIFSLWQPWYSFRIPTSVLDQAIQGSQNYGVLGPVIRRGAAILASLGTIHINAWQVFTTSPAILLAVGVIAGGLSLLALTDRATHVNRFVAGAAIVGVAVVLYRMVVRPADPSGLLHLGWGIYVALASALVTVAGAFVAHAAEQAEQEPSLPVDPWADYAAPEPEPLAGSLPPPSFE